jgi:hypothetical protein
MKIYSQLYYTTFLSIILIVNFLFTSCKNSNELNREKAEELIVKKFGFPQKATKSICYMIMAHEKVQLNMVESFETILNNFDFIKFENLEKVESGGTFGNEFLTEKGKKEIDTAYNRTEDSRIIGLCYYFKMGIVDFIGVTGIQISNDNKKAQVEYSWKYSNLTNIGNVVSKFSTSFNENDVHNNVLTFILYDDGWRIEENLVLGTNVKIPEWDY